MYSPPNVSVNKSRRIRWKKQIERMGEIKNAYKIVVGNPDGKRQLGRSRRR